jgi:uncharacterized protein YdaU (DUF1376 family)
MDAEEVGAYFLLLCYAWLSDTQGVLANDDELLARLTRLGSRWPQHKAAVLRAFVVTDKRLVQKRMVAEAKPTAERIARAEAVGKKGAAARWRKPLDAGGIADAQPTHASSSSSSSSTNQEAAFSLRSKATSDVSVEENKSAVRDLLAGLAGQMDVGPAKAPKSTKKAGPAELAWEWLKQNATREEAASGMELVGWLIKTGTKDAEVLRALVKTFIVYKPKNVFAYFTPEGKARQSIALRASSDAAIIEHERLKREERAFIEGKE